MAGKYAIETVFRLIDKATAPMSNIDKQAKIVNRSLKNMYAGAEKAAARAGGAFKKMAGSIGGALGLGSLLNIDKLIGFTTQDIKNAMQFSDTMARISTVVDTAKVPLAQLQKQFTDAANASGFAVQEISKIALAAIPSGIAAESSAQFAGVVAKTAKVTGSSSDTIIDALTTVMNAYGMSGDEAARVSGLMLMTNNMGKTSFEEMAKSFRQVIPTANQFGVNINDVFASVTALTAKGEKTKDAMKLMADAITNIVNPSKEAAAAAKYLGIDFSEAALRSKGFAGFMDDIGKKTGGNRKVLEKLFGNEDIGRIMGILTTTGKAAFEDALAQMTSGAGTIIDEAFEKITSTPQERWNKAVNKMRNTSLQIGAALIPVVDKVIDKINEIAGQISKMDLSGFTTAMSGAFDFIYGLVSAFMFVVKAAWHLRGVLLVVAGALGAYYGVSMLVVGVSKAIVLWEKIKGIAVLASTILFGNQTAALALLKGGTLGYLVVDKLFAAATVARNVIMNILTGGTLAQTAATASMAVATGTATGAQWALNAAMSANPIGFILTVVIAGVAALIGLIILLIKNLDYVKAAFQSLGDVIILVLLKPLQLILELIDLIPGVDLEATKSLRKMNDDAAGRISGRFSKVKEDRAAKKQAKEKSEMDKLTGGFDMSAITPPEINAPEFNIPEIDIPDFSAGGKTKGGKSKLHGVVDLSGGEDFTGGAGALGKAVGAAGAAVESDTITRNVTGIYAAIMRIDANVTKITQSVPAGLPRMEWNGGGAGGTQTASGADINPYNISPVTQGERTAYSLQERRETVGIEVSAAAGTDARIIKKPHDIDIKLIHSGSNA